MFKVKARLVDFLGDEEKYPCHFCHQVGDEVVFDGEKYVGRLCPDVWPLLVPKANALHQAGPRYVDPAFYYPFWYAPPSVRDPARKRFDGLGFANVLQTRVESQYHMANLVPPDAFKWPPHPERTVAREPTVVCPDFRTCAVFVLKAFDLSDKGYSVPFFRRQMAILDRVSNKQGLPVNKIISHFSTEEREDIYPPLVPELLIPMVEELQLVGYLDIRDDHSFVTEKGKQKLEGFKKRLSSDEKEALGL